MKNPSLLQSIETLLDLTPHLVRKEFGGKAFGLLEAKKMGLPIPNTWLIGSRHYEQFTQSISGSKKFVEKSESYLKENYPEAFSELPDTLFAVRSSSEFEDSQEHSFAGIFESKLNVDRSNLARAIGEVWDSCHSLRATDYLKERAHFLRMGIIIQPMIEAKYAGVAFSKHPSPANVFENHNLVIEFAHSSGEKVVQGEVIPWRFSGTEESISSTTDLPWMGTLLKTLIELKNFHHFDVDIEFVIDKSDQFHLVQQRPISRINRSHLLDLSCYERKYKRALHSLDIELLINGCARHLASYLNIPYQLERWMVMTTHLDGNQELWVHKLLDEAIVSRLASRFQNEPTFLSTIEKRYHHYLRVIQEADYNAFFDQERPLEKRFFDWCEFITPCLAHYYVPMLMIEALHLSLIQEFKKIDPQNADDDLFFLGTFEISSLMDLLKAELLLVKNDAPHAKRFADLSNASQIKLAELALRYGFLKCHQVYEEGYNEEELFEQMLDAKIPVEPSSDLKAKFDVLQKKYLIDPHAKPLLRQFRQWLKYRNQEMEYVMYAILQSRPLFSEMSSFLNLSIKEIWNGSSELLLKAIQKRDGALIRELTHKKLVIYHSYGKTRLTNHLKIIGLEEEQEKALHGKKVFGEGKIDLEVVLAFSPDELKNLEESDKPRVLVTGMTTPDFIPFLKKQFSALITDEGGILCHAAIIAREISMPCIVGTGSGTEILKNGMWVRLDFDRGTIELLSKTSNIR